MANQQINILQITDPHLFADPQQDLLGVVTYKSLQAVVEHALQTAKLHKPQLTVLSGDLSQDDSVEAYRNLTTLMSDFSPPIGWIPGNHDAPQLMQQIFVNSPFSNQKHFILGNWQILLLDSHWSGHIKGFLAFEQLQFLERMLQQYQQHAVIFLHHPAFPVGSAWVDPHKLDNSDEFLAILSKFPQVRAVVCGHVHQESEQVKDGIQFISTPSTCIQFKPLSENFTLDTQMPGYRYLHLEPDGSLSSSLYRIDFNPSFLGNSQSQGY